MKVEFSDEVEQHKVTKWIRAHKSAARVIAAIVLTLVVVGLLRFAVAAPLSIECAGSWSMSGSTATCTPTGSPGTPSQPGTGTPGTPGTPPVTPPAGCSVVPSAPNMSLTAPGPFAIPFTVEGTALRTISWSPYLGGGTWDYAISASPCDFANPVPAVNANGKVQTYPAAGTGTNGYITARHKGGANVVVGQTYYFNARGSSGAIIAGSAP